MNSQDLLSFLRYLAALAATVPAEGADRISSDGNDLAANVGAD